MNNRYILDKLIDVMVPIVIYLLAGISAQVAFTLYMSISKIKDIDKSGNFYDESANFLENLEIIVEKNSLMVTFITILVVLPIMFIMFYRLKGNITFDGTTKKLYEPVIVGIFASLGISKFVTLFPIDGIIGDYAKTSEMVMDSDITLQIIALVILGPMMEELMFRGIMYSRLKEINEKNIAIYIISLMFAIYHFNLVQGIYTFVLSILLCFAYEKYNTIWAPILLHISANGVAVLLNYISFSKTIASHWYLKIPVMVVEIGILIIMILKLDGGLFRKNNPNVEEVKK